MRNPTALLLLAMVLPTAHAQTPAPSETIEIAEANQYFSVLPGFFGADTDRGGTRRGITGSGIYGYRWSPHWGVELNLMGSTIETGRSQGTDFYQQGGTVDLVYGFKDRGMSWTPFALLGVGAVQNDVIPDSEDAVSFIANAGLGAVSAPLTRLSFKLRGEGRYQVDQFQGGYNDYRLLAGIEFPFGSRSVRLAALVPPAVEIREVVKEVYLPAPFVDTDKDTIEDSRDQCSDTPEGLKVDADGCVIEGQVLELRGVTFALNQSALQLNAQTVLDYVAKGMKGQPTMTVEIAGHTDSLGTASYNQQLSQRRAEAVSGYLTAQGIATTRLTAKGYGESELMVNPETSEIDKERNRRVVFRVVGR